MLCFMIGAVGLMIGLCIGIWVGGAFPDSETRLFLLLFLLYRFQEQSKKGSHFTARELRSAGGGVFSSSLLHPVAMRYPLEQMEELGLIRARTRINLDPGAPTEKEYRLLPAGDYWLEHGRPAKKPPADPPPRDAFPN